MSDEQKYKRLYAFALIMIILALIGYSAAISAQTTADANANITNVFEILVNNTNLAPSEVGHPGTGERITGIKYTNSLYPIELFVFSHADTAGQISEIHIFVNGTKILDTSGKPLGAAEQNNKSLTAIIPKDSIYMVEFSNTHHYEWREYPILSGRNGTLSINQTGGTSNHANLTNLNWSVAGHILDSDMYFTQSNLKLYSYNNNSYIDFNSGINIFNLNVAGEVSNINIGNNSEARNDLNVQKTTGNYSNSTEILQNSTEINFLINETSRFNISNNSVTINTTLNMQNNSIQDVNIIAVNTGITLRNDSYIHIRNITINNSANNSYQHNLSVMLNLSWDSDMRTDFGDVRIWNRTTETILPYTNTTIISSSTAEFWFNINIAGSTTDTTSYYLTYGNASLTSNRTPEMVFNQYHGYSSMDFNDSNINNFPFIYEGLVARAAISSQVDWGVSNLANPFTYGDALYQTYDDAGTHIFLRTINNGVSTYVQNTTSTTNNQYYWYKIIAVNLSQVKYYRDNIYLGEVTTNVPNQVMGLTQRLGSGTNGYQQWSFTRKYIYPDPIISVGAEYNTIAQTNYFCLKVTSTGTLITTSGIC